MTLADFGPTLLDAEHLYLQEQGAKSSGYWDKQPDAEKPLFARFKSEVKRYYRAGQDLLCCYCSCDLQYAQNTYDLEHILDKADHPHHMFALNNLAAACKSCNTSKGKSTVVVEGVDTDTVPTQHEHYTIVHPHIDEWHDFFTFDEVGRVSSLNGNVKGQNTIRVCGISAVNATRLARSFAGNAGHAETQLRKFFEYKSIGKKEACLDFLRSLTPRLKVADEIVEHLTLEVERLKAEQDALKEQQQRARRVARVAQAQNADS
ncbi:hypothetical protein [Paraburkholderia fynbosensis]|uniref:HNH nuclease domain-containing protein n=1 Tax=Paraburkholderia fynbosensis TaxID=1200993 RepID=A0A6J5G9K7_9BURK|nr:hypothetical protein [Paraburkholderia fynbosensis]CAB3794504.1 hypothetical protein LMG27177_03643 [Paraburkholderia fynbosensis]